MPSSLAKRAATQTTSKMVDNAAMDAAAAAVKPAAVQAQPKRVAKTSAEPKVEETPVVSTEEPSVEAQIPVVENSVEPVEVEISPKTEEDLPEIPEQIIDKTKTRKRSITTKRDVVSLKNFPNTMMEAVRAQVPNINLTNPEAVAVIVALYTGVTTGLAPHVLEEVKQQKASEKTLDTVLNGIKVLGSKIDSLQHTADEANLTAAYAVYDRLNFRKSNITVPSEVDLDEPGMEDFMKNIRKTSREISSREEMKKRRRTQ